MKEELTFGKIMEKALRAALPLGLISIAFSALYALLLNWTAAAPDVNSMSMRSLVVLIIPILWIAKFAACILILRAGMKKLSEVFSGVRKADTFRYGAVATFLSSLLFAAAYCLVFPIEKEATILMQGKMASLQSMLGGIQGMEAMIADGIDQLKSVRAIDQLIPTFTGAWLYGVILSFILSRFFPKDKGPWADEEE